METIGYDLGLRDYSAVMLVIPKESLEDGAKLPFLQKCVTMIRFCGEIISRKEYCVKVIKQQNFF